MVRGRTAPDENTRVGEALGAALLRTIEIVPNFWSTPRGFVIGSEWRSL